MSINNLSNDRSGAGGNLPLLNSRPSFLRDDGMPTMIRTIERYAADTMPSHASSGVNAANGRLLDAGNARTIDYKAMAQAMLARLDALRERFADRDGAASDSTFRNAGPSAPHHAGSNGWSHHGQWYATTASASTTVAAPPVSSPPPPPATSTQTSSTAPAPAPAPSPAPVPTAAPQPPATTSPTPTSPAAPTATVGAPPSGSLASSGSITLSSGATALSDTIINGMTGIVGNNGVAVSSLDLNNVAIRSTNYGIYLGSAQNVTLRNVDITTDPNGGDSYAVRGSIRNFVSSDSTFRSGIKAFRIYGLEGGSSTRDTFIGGRLMLGGSAANVWDPHQPFRNFTFTDSRIDVDSVEIYRETSNVTFSGVDWSGTGHISIFSGAHDIVIQNSDSAVPLIKFYDSSGNRYYPSAAELASRNIVIGG